LFNPIILKVDIVNTRLVLNIPPVYPARRRKPKITTTFVCYNKVLLVTFYDE